MASLITTPNLASAISLDAADGVLDGRYFNSNIGVQAPVYRTGGYGTYSSLGLAGATSALSLGSYPTTSYPATSYPAGAYSGLSTGYPYTPAPLPTTSFSTNLMSSSFQLPTTQYSSSLTQYAAPVTQYAAPVTQYAAPVTQYATAPVTQYATAPVVQQVAQVEYVQPPPVVQYVQAPPQIQYVQSPPEIRYIQSPPEIRYIEAPPQPAPLPPPPSEDPRLLLRIRELEEEVASLRARLSQKAEIKSQTSVHQTYKVKSFEVAAKLAVMDGTDDGLYNGLPIEVEGEGLYRDLVAAGRRPKANVSLTGRPTSQTTTSETYKVQSYEMGEKLSKMDGTDDGKYNGLPIEVAGQGLFTDLRRQRGWR